MATRNIVPRATGEGSIGTSAKTWGAVYADDIAVTNGVTASAFTGDLTGDVTGNADTATSATNDGNGNNIASTYLPAVVGAVVAYAGSTTPNGWLLCDGSDVSRTTYANLFAVIGTTYGAGDGSTTFGLPTLTDKFIQGSSTSGTVKTAGLPNITGGTNNLISGVKHDKTAGETWAGSIGIGSSYTSTVAQNSSSERGYAPLKFDASRSSSIYGNSTTVQPPALTMRYIIKY